MDDFGRLLVQFKTDFGWGGVFVVVLIVVVGTLFWYWQNKPNEGARATATVRDSGNSNNTNTVSPTINFNPTIVVTGKAESDRPRPTATLSAAGDSVYVDVNNDGGTAMFTAHILKGEGFESWPQKTLWARWDHDKGAKTMRIARGTPQRLRMATRFIAEDASSKWKCFWGSDHAMGQGTIGRPGPTGRLTLHCEITADPEFSGTPLQMVVLLHGDGTSSRG